MFIVTPCRLINNYRKDTFQDMGFSSTIALRQMPKGVTRMRRRIARNYSVSHIILDRERVKITIFGTN